MRYAFLDIESTSLRSPWQPAGRQAWEVAYVIDDGSGELKGVEFLIGDVNIADADATALKIGRFHDRHPKGVNFYGRVHDDHTILMSRVAARHIYEDLQGCHIVGANPAFDMNTLEVLLHEHGYPVPWHYRSFDVESIAAGSVGRPIGGLADCAECFGIEVDPKREHTAMGDVQTVIKIWNTIMTQMGAEE